MAGSGAQYHALQQQPFAAPGDLETHILIANVNETNTDLGCSPPRIANMMLPPWAVAAGVTQAQWTALLDDLRVGARQFKPYGVGKVLLLTGIFCFTFVMLVGVRVAITAGDENVQSLLYGTIGVILVATISSLACCRRGGAMMREVRQNNKRADTAMLEHTRQLNNKYAGLMHIEYVLGKALQPGAATYQYTTGGPARGSSLDAVGDVLSGTGTSVNIVYTERKFVVFRPHGGAPHAARNGAAPAPAPHAQGAYYPPAHPHASYAAAGPGYAAPPVPGAYGVPASGAVVHMDPPVTGSGVPPPAAAAVAVVAAPTPAAASTWRTGVKSDL